MEADEAADALRDLDENLRHDLLAHMVPESAKRARAILAHDETTAGGFMNTSLFTAQASEKVGDVSARLRSLGADPKEVESVAVIDESGRILCDLALVDLLVADQDKKLGDFVKPPKPVTVTTNALINEVAELLVESRRSSILVVDRYLPLGRIFADDVVDALLPEYGGFHFPRLLS